jgi:hypothetical protein
MKSSSYSHSSDMLCSAMFSLTFYAQPLEKMKAGLVARCIMCLFCLMCENVKHRVLLLTCTAKKDIASTAAATSSASRKEQQHQQIIEFIH